MRNFLSHHFVNILISMDIWTVTASNANHYSMYKWMNMRESESRRKIKKKPNGIWIKSPMFKMRKSHQKPKSSKYLCVKMHVSNDQMGLGCCHCCSICHCYFFRMVFNIYSKLLLSISLDNFRGLNS